MTANSACLPSDFVFFVKTGRKFLCHDGNCRIVKSRIKILHVVQGLFGFVCGGGIFCFFVPGRRVAMGQFFETFDNIAHFYQKQTQNADQPRI